MANKGNTIYGVSIIETIHFSWCVSDLKSRLSYVHTCAGRLRSGGRRILAFPLCYCGYVHTYAGRTRSGRGRTCHFLRTMMVWSAPFRSGRGKLGVGPISCGADFAPAPPPPRDRACVNTCNDLCWSQFFARLHPRPPAHVWMYLYVFLNQLEKISINWGQRHISDTLRQIL